MQCLVLWFLSDKMMASTMCLRRGQANARVCARSLEPQSLGLIGPRWSQAARHSESFHVAFALDHDPQALRNCVSNCGGKRFVKLQMTLLHAMWTLDSFR